MSFDPLLPITPARVKALVVPIGQIKQDRFAAFVERLNAEHVVHLRDISADGRPNRNMFSPLAFPDGAMFYELMTHVPPPSHVALSPFDLYREPLALIAVADGCEVQSTAFNKRHSSGGKTVAERNIRSLYQELENLRDTHPKILVHHVLIFDYVATTEDPIPIPEGILTIPPVEQSKRTTMKTVMCDISSLLLAEMTGLARSYEAQKYVDSPGQSSTIRSLNGASNGWEDDARKTPPARRNSQFSLPASRSSSAGGAGDRNHARMSMPPGAFGKSASTSSTPARPSTPVRSGMSNPPTTFDDMVGKDSSAPTSPETTAGSSSSARPDLTDGFRTQSQDRVSVQGFGSGGANERFRNKGRGRVQIVTGSLYLQAGRWSDSIRELVEGGTTARSVNDHLWHGKALELILINLLLLGWAGLEFQVPTLLLPPADKAAAPGGGSVQEIEIHDHTQPRCLKNLQVILPELLERILGLYSRITAEHLPPLPLSEATIRFGKMLAAVHVCDGLLAKRSVDMMVWGVGPDKTLTTSPRFTIAPTRTSIAALVLKAFPGGSSELLTTVDRIGILSGIASVLGVLGFRRKKAMVVRELVSVLIGGLVEARTRGAADVGIHPAAGLMAHGVGGQGNGSEALLLGEGDIEHGIDAFLGLLLKTYGVVTYDVLGDAAGADKEDGADMEDDAHTIGRIQRQAAARFFGIQNVKLNMLRACINFSEALPDFAGVLRFSSDLLRTAGSGIAPGPKREDASPTLYKEEQVRLVTNISKTSNLARRLGLGRLEAEYWDEFLVRGVQLEPLPPTRAPAAHARSVLPEATVARASQDVNPFIYNPFLKQPDKAAAAAAAAADRVLVAGEAATFKVTLQNPYEVEVEVESIRLDTEGVAFESAVATTAIGPYRTQIIKMKGTALADGPLKVTGAMVRVRGCRERRFPIFADPWSPEDDIKVKAVGLGALERRCAQGPKVATPAPRPEHLELAVIAEQPVVVVRSTTLPQSSVMILEGERQAFSVTVQNLSATTPVDFILFSFQNSTQEAVQAALSNRDATPAELYECELILAKKQALRLRNASDKDRSIAPGGTATFEFEILGRPGLTKGTIQMDYAHLGVPHDQVADRFYTRQVSLELTVTVNASVEVVRADILPIHGSIPAPLWTRTGHASADPAADEYCLLLLDLRNSWPGLMTVTLEVDGATVEEPILPGNTARLVLPVRKVLLADPHAAIPALNPSRQRQFVVSAKISPAQERATREAFWYRERLLDAVRGSWRAGSRSGALELRGMRLTGRMIEALRVEEVGVEVVVEDADSKAAAEIYVDDFVQVRVRLTNRTDRPIYPLLRLAPSLRHRPVNVSLDLTRKFAWNGALQRPLPVLGAGASVECVVGVTALCRGEFELQACVEETRIWRPSAEEEELEQGSKGRPRSETQTVMDAALGVRERRVWVGRGAVVVVRDREE